MNLKSLIDNKNSQLRKQNYISFTPAELSALRPDEAAAIIRKFHGSVLMRLPDTEVQFFNWLRKEDPPVWNDLWEDEEDLYLVSVDLLTQFIDGGPGFPICDLVDQPNYWFNARHIKPKGLEYLEIIINKLEQGKPLDLAENFLIQLSTIPTDIWHYSYQNDLQPEELKKRVEEMVFRGWLVHLADREDLLKYIDI